MIIGGIYESNNAGKFEVLDIMGRKCLIRFITTGYETVKSYWDAKRGEVEDKYIRRVYGVGYVGGDLFLPSENKKHTKSYSAWRDMLRRCYTDHGGSRVTSYSTVECAETWHNFQNFAEWYTNQTNYAKDGFELDKDLTVFGSKLYSPSTCEIIPKELNAMFVGVIHQKDRTLPVGVSKSKRDGYFRVRVIDTTNSKVITKYGKDPVALGATYAKLKQQIVCSVVEKYTDILSERLQTNLICNTEKYLLKQLETYT